MAARQRERALDQARELRAHAAEERERARFLREKSINSTERIKAQLEKDGYITGNEKKIKIKVTEDKITVNGKRLNGDDEARYRRMFWPNTCEGCSSELNFTND